MFCCVQEDATATALHTEQLNAEQRRKQHPLPVTAADYQHMETQIQQALAEDLQMVSGKVAILQRHCCCPVTFVQCSPYCSLVHFSAQMDDEDSDVDASDADNSDAEDSDADDSDVEDSNSHAIPTSTTAAGGAPAIAARAASAARNVSTVIYPFVSSF